MTLPDLFKSYRFYVALVSLVFVFLGDNTGFDQKQVTEAVWLIASLIISLGIRAPGKSK